VTMYPEDVVERMNTVAMMKYAVMMTKNVVRGIVATLMNVVMMARVSLNVQILANVLTTRRTPQAM
jgi:hypothetical protein